MSDVLYEKDFFAWTEEQVNLLQSGRLGEVDVTNLIEEVATMGRSERKELQNRLTILIMHLLKWQFQPALQGHSWVYTIRHQRTEIAKVLKDSPSLKRFLNDETWLQDLWIDAVDDAVLETGYTADMFPSTPIWTVEQILDSEFFPSQPSA